MTEKFDELTKSLANSVTRRGALKKFGIGLAGVALASLGLANKAEAAPDCKSNADCAAGCCRGKCVDLNSDFRNCGACGRRCLRWQHGEYCAFGNCRDSF